MMRSLFSGVSGLKVHQTKMDVIGNNISNVNTAGYKTSRTTFAEIFSQTLAGASGANDETLRGGINAMQIGLGASLASIDMLMTQGAAQRTDNPLDLMIEGDGFFIVGDANGMRFTRAGAFRLDVDGTITTPGTGLVLHGWQAVPDDANPGKNRIQQGKAEPINILEGEKGSVPAKPTTYVTMEGNLSIDQTFADPADPFSIPLVKTISFYDTLGNRYTINATFELANNAGSSTATNDWQVTIGTDVLLNNEDVGASVTWGAGNPFTLNYDTSGKLVGINGGTDTEVKLLLSDASGTGGAVISGLPFETSFEDITLAFSGTASYQGLSTAKFYPQNGNVAGNLSGWSVGVDGKITGVYTNGDTKLLGQIALAKFRNPAGLERIGNNLYNITANSGDFDGVGEDPTASGGKLTAGVLEMSNVDLSQEFTEMITTQRGFQANSKTITTSDDMLQELINLKR